VIYNKYYKNKRRYKARVASEFYSISDNKISPYDDMIKKYGKIPINGKPSYNDLMEQNNGMTFYRGYNTIEDLVKMAKQPFSKATDEYIYENDLFDKEDECGSGMPSILTMASKQQTKLIKHWKAKGYFVINLVKITPTGLPDLIALKPNEVIFIESKEIWDKLSPLQIAKIEILKKLKFKVYVNENEC